jgi:hypothetical protein
VNAICRRRTATTAGYETRVSADRRFGTRRWFEGKTHKRNFDAVTTAPTRFIALTQGHNDHTGGVARFREPETLLIAQANKARACTCARRSVGVTERGSLSSQRRAVRRSRCSAAAARVSTAQEWLEETPRLGAILFERLSEPALPD